MDASCRGAGQWDTGLRVSRVELRVMADVGVGHRRRRPAASEPAHDLHPQRADTLSCSRIWPARAGHRPGVRMCCGLAPATPLVGFDPATIALGPRSWSASAMHFPRDSVAVS